MKWKSFVAVVLFAAVVVSVQAQSGNQVFVGEISDSQCALNVHSKTGSHKEMLAMKTMGDTEADCVRTCVRYGGVYVLVSGSKVYKLSDQTTPEKFAAQKVKVSGTLDKKTNTIVVQSIQPGA